jgi:predicted acylesterase/phospholipase RssA/CRP-like cAMP-binding protein
MSSALAEFRANLIEILLASPVFGALGTPVIHALANALEPFAAAGGSMVVREGDASDSMMFVLSGSLRVSRQGPSEGLRLYNEIRPGMSFGEVGLILRQPRAADVVAVRDSMLAVLSRADFEILLAQHPVEINQVFVRTVYNHLRHAEEAPTRRHAQTFVVVPLIDGAVGDDVAASLAQALTTMGRTHLLHAPQVVGNGHSVNPANPVNRNASLQPDRITPQTTAAQDALEENSDFLVYVTQPSDTDWTLRAFRQADQVVFVSRPDASHQESVLERQLKAQPAFSMKRLHLVVLHESDAMLPCSTSAWHIGRKLERIYPLRRQRADDFERLARFLTGKAVGVVLGGGGARGFAHVGVLRALQESGIPVDLIGGNSMGALIAAQYAQGVALNEIITKTRKFAQGGEHPTLPLISLVSGKRVSRDLRKMFGETDIDQLWIPFFASACNLTQGCTTVQDRGPLWRAVLASNSPAGLLPPVLYQGDMLVDGAILENVPVAAMRQRLGTPLERRRGNGTIIAIDVDVLEPLGVDPELTRLSVWKALKGYFYAQPYRSPRITDILYRAGHIGGLNQRSRTIAQADHYLEPPVSGFAMMSYRKADEIAQVGYLYAMEHMEQWKHPDPSTSR